MYQRNGYAHLRLEGVVVLQQLGVMLANDIAYIIDQSADKGGRRLSDHGLPAPRLDWNVQPCHFPDDRRPRAGGVDHHGRIVGITICFDAGHAPAAHQQFLNGLMGKCLCAHLRSLVRKGQI